MTISYHRSPDPIGYDHQKMNTPELRDRIADPWINKRELGEVAPEPVVPQE